MERDLDELVGPAPRTSNIGMMMAGGKKGQKTKSDPLNFYPTPPEPTIALIERFLPEIPKRVWEPACGTGAMASVLSAHGYDVVSTDIDDYDYGRPYVNFLTAEDPPGVEAVITNPPFSIANAFIERALAVKGVTFVAMFLKATFWNARSRYDLHRRHPPKAVMPLTWRVDFNGLGRPTMDCCWVIWGDAVPQIGHEPLLRP